VDNLDKPLMKCTQAVTVVGFAVV